MKKYKEKITLSGTALLATIATMESLGPIGLEVLRKYKIKKVEKHKQYPIEIRNAIFSKDNRPLDENCDCEICQNYSRAYLHHLVKSSEILGSVFITQHNLYFYRKLMKKIRDSIIKGNLDNLKL